MYHPREVLKAAVQFSATAFVLVHNHPSGDPSPSMADSQVTADVKKAAPVLQIEFLDHIILGTGSGGDSPYFSFKEAGMV